MKLYSMMLPYFLLVTFFTPNNLNKFTGDHLAALNNSPYYGAAVPLIDAYDTKQYSLSDFSESIRRLKRATKKDIWPWVFFNRFIGNKEGDRAHSPLAQAPYFRRINGMDIFNQAGALGDFYHIWRIALRAAKEMGAPGIFVDHEAYNNYGVYNVQNVAKSLGVPDEQVRSQLKAIGAELVDLADQEFPQAVLWFTSTGLGITDKWSIHNPYRTVTYIVIGMLERAKAKGSQLKIVCGGEVALGYCYTSLADLQGKIKNRNQLFAPFTNTFPNLQLGGCITVWESPENKKGWLASGPCGNSQLQTIADFGPLFDYLFKSYNYVWVYAATVSGYNPYDDHLARNVNTHLRNFITSIRE
jgi:hypothetical protein